MTGGALLHFLELIYQLRSEPQSLGHRVEIASVAKVDETPCRLPVLRMHPNLRGKLTPPEQCIKFIQNHLTTLTLFNALRIDI